MLFRDREDSQWESISDLMTGLMVIFLFVCLGFLYQLNQNISLPQKGQSINQSITKE